MHLSFFKNKANKDNFVSYNCNSDNVKEKIDFQIQCISNVVLITSSMSSIDVKTKDKPTIWPYYVRKMSSNDMGLCNW